MKLHENDYSEIIHLKKENCLVQVWKRFCMPDEFRETHLRTIDFLREHKFDYLIMDTTNAGVLKKEEAEWAAQVAAPKILATGISELFLVVPKSVFTQMSLDRYEESAENGLKSTYFPSYDAAIKHIKENK